jgi:flagellin
MTVINTNIAASITANAMKSNQRTMENTMERLSTGKRINSAADDAAGLAIGSKMEAQIRGLGQAVRNANDGISMIQTADGAAVEIGDMLQRMRELAVQASNQSNSSAELSNLNKEFIALATEIDRVADDTTFNNINVLNGAGAKTFTVGADVADTVSVTFGDFNLAAGATAGTAAQFDMNLTEAQYRAIGDGKGIKITDNFGQVLHVTEANIEHGTAANGALSGSNGTLANLVTSINLALAVNTQFGKDADGNGGFTVATNSTEGVRFTQSVAGTGSIVNAVASPTTPGPDTAIASLTFDTQVSYATGTGVMAANISDFKNADQAQVSTTIAELDAAIAGVASARSDFGAAINTMEYSIDNLNNAVQNTMAAKSAIMDADYASETTELARTQIISQASTAMLSQANQQAQSVLALLK